MILGRYVPMGLMLAIAGEFSTQTARGTPEPIRTDGLPFTVTLFVLTFLLSALAFLPFRVIGRFVWSVVPTNLLRTHAKTGPPPDYRRALPDALAQPNPLYL